MTPRAPRPRPARADEEGRDPWPGRRRTGCRPDDGRRVRARGGRCRGRAGREPGDRRGDRTGLTGRRCWSATTICRFVARCQRDSPKVLDGRHPDGQCASSDGVDSTQVASLPVQPKWRKSTHAKLPRESPLPTVRDRSVGRRIRARPAAHGVHPPGDRGLLADLHGDDERRVRRARRPRTSARPSALASGRPRARSRPPRKTPWPRCDDGPASPRAT